MIRRPSSGLHIPKPSQPSQPEEPPPQPPPPTDEELKAEADRLWWRQDFSTAMLVIGFIGFMVGCKGINDPNIPMAIAGFTLAAFLIPFSYISITRLYKSTRKKK